MAQVKIEEIMGIGGKRKFFFLGAGRCPKMGYIPEKGSFIVMTSIFLDKPIKDLG